MGAVHSIHPQAGDGEGIYLRDQRRFSVSALSVTADRNRTLLNITPNLFPATKYNVKKELGDEAPVSFVLDPEAASNGAMSHILCLNNEEELTFNFTCVVRQVHKDALVYESDSRDNVITGLTFVFASTSKELDNLVTREFHANPNLHKNPQVALVGDYSTGGHPSVQFKWSWKWKPPKSYDDRTGGWRTTCGFVEYDPQAHKLKTLANFTFWVKSAQADELRSPKSLSPRIELGVPPRLRVPSAQSMDSRVSDSDEYKDTLETMPPKSPVFDSIPEDGLGLIPSQTTTLADKPVKVDVNCARPNESLGQTEDGPLFRATIKSWEQKTGSMRTRWKKVLKRAEAALEAQTASNNAASELMEALREVSSSNSNAVQPAMEHYFDKIEKEILKYERSRSSNLQKLIIDPVSKLYNVDLKQADAKRKDFEEESEQYYSYAGRYLGQRQDSLKEKKRADSDKKYQTRMKNYELSRFDYYSFMQDLHGGRKDQEVLSNLSRFAEAQARNHLDTSSNIETMMPQLEAFTSEVKETDKEFQLQRTEREEKRRQLEKSKKPSEPLPSQSIVSSASLNGSKPRSIPSASDGDLPGRKASITPIFSNPVNSPPGAMMPSLSSIGSPASPDPSLATIPTGSPQPNKFKGIRDLEEKDLSLGAGSDQSTHRKEGLVWALSKPGSHVDPKGLNRQAWHKFWIVCDQGKLSEYTNWKQSLDLHMDPIDLRVASVRDARNAERRFCFEVITPQFTRVYQATSEGDMKAWIAAINIAIASAVEMTGTGKIERPSNDSLPGSNRRDIASVLTGKSSSVSSQRNHYSSKHPARHATVGERPATRRVDGLETDGRLLQQVREADAGNNICADCGSENKVDWVSINLGIVICIECSGIHRSLGTHITKVRSLTLDTTSFTKDIVEVLLKIGNRVSNMIWEARLDRAQKPTAASTREQRLSFITSKYVDRSYVAPISPTLSHYSSAQETLIASIKQNDIQNVLYALALRADPNSKDRSRNTPYLFLALAAADPAPPFPQSQKTTPQTAETRKAFAIAEMLLQNGAELPTSVPPFPLSSSGTLYLQQKLRAAGRGSDARV
ncbi:centaurin-beta-2 [Polyplosphaeria fusca]|uniref:ADP-ribosylation factor GTPase-activating protein n=1 Tax=Polyplosphaeria fusca TaxID=682080 RepID=A0A9P4QQ28_9PLEO|nr:centaurin-beta-2 [Polyplosphaeria fusca]